MTYRTKLLILLFSISVIPVIGLRAFGIHNVHIMAEKISDQVRLSQTIEAENHLHRILDAFLKTVQSTREQTELIVLSQAHEIENKIRSSFPSLMSRSPIASPSEELTNFRWWFENDHTATAPVFKIVSSHIGDIIIGHHIGFANGIRIGYPPRDNVGKPKAVRLETWYQTAFEEKPYLWSGPFMDEPTNQLAIAVSVPLTLDDEYAYGVTSIWISLSAFLQQFASLDQIPPHSGVYLCSIEMNPADDRVGARILMVLKDGQVQNAAISNEKPSSWLISSDSDHYQRLLSEIAFGRNGIVKMPRNHSASFWIFTPIPRQGVALIATIPVDDVLSDQQFSSISISDRVRKVELMTAGFLAFLIALILFFAFSFANTVTRSISKVSKAAAKLAGGDFKAHVDIDSKDEFGNLAKVFNALGPQLEEHYMVQRSMEVAVEIQQNLLPQYPPTIPGFDIFGITFYSERVGGDYFDYLCVDEKLRKFCVAVGDVADHGIPSALIMASVRALMRLRSLQSGPVEDVISDVNRELSRDVSKSGQFMTMFLTRIDQCRHTLTWIRAGHDPAMLYRINRDEFVRLEGKGLPLGVDGNALYSASTVNFDEGDILLIGTDGIWESRSPTGEMFGKERIMNLVRASQHENAQTMVLSILDELDEFRGGLKLEDDVTLVIVKM